MRETTRSGASLRVAVASDQALVAESIRAALTSRDFDAVVLAWPLAAQDDDPPPAPSPLPRLGLMLSHLDRPAWVQAATRLIAGLPVDWVVLAGVPRGPVWGALLDSGAKIVVPTSTTLEEAVQLLRLVASGEGTGDEAGRAELIEEYRALQAQQQSAAMRLASMTKREEQVLELLHSGSSVRTIAEMAEVSEATVRSQVKAVLRKLEVHSQIAAVAMLESARTS